MSIRKGRLTSQGLLATPVNFPIATIHAFAGTSAPEGWAMCDGSEVSKTQYAALYAVIGDIYGTPVDSNNFVLPDLRGEFLRGLDDMGTAAGARGKDVDGTARTVGQTQVDATAPNGLGTNTTGNHTHTQQIDASTGTNTALLGESTRASTPADYTISNISSAGNHSHTITSSDTETRPANIAINYIIKL